MQAAPLPRGPTLRTPPLGINSTALKWEAPVTVETRAAAAGLLAQLVQLPHLRAAASDRLAAPRLAALVLTTMQQLAAAAGEAWVVTVAPCSCAWWNFTTPSKVLQK